MAYIGLAAPVIAKRDSDGTYSDGFRCGKAVETSITPQYAEGSLFGDNTKAEYDKEFKYADVSLGTTSLPVEAHKVMFGHEVADENDGTITFKATDEAGYVGFGFYVTEKVDGKKRYVACWLPKCKFSEGADTFKTKGDNVEYQTPTISGQALATDEGTWKELKICDKEEDAITWINGKAEIEEAQAVEAQTENE